MSDQYVTLLDIAKASNRDEVVALIEKNTIVAPEFNVVKGMGISGTNYNLHLRSLPNSVGFRAANAGVSIGKSTYESRLVECFILAAEMQVDVAVAAADPKGEAAAMEREASGYMEAALITLSNQFYYGTQPGGLGFQGLASYMPGLTPVNGFGVIVNAGGNTANAMTSVYLARCAENGLQFVWGKNGQIDLDPIWRKQQVSVTNPSGSTGHMTAWVNNLMMWVGLQVGHPLTIGRICNINPSATPGASNTVTDALIQNAIRQFPIDKQPTHIFMNRVARYQLQASRSAVTGRLGNEGVIWAPQPDESNGIPIVLTDGILNTEPVLS